MKATHAVIALVLTALAFATAAAQNADTRLAFDVATIRKHATGAGGAGWAPGGQFHAIDVDARTIIAMAYRTADTRIFASQVVDGPDWTATERYDINASVDAELAKRRTSQLLPVQGPLLQSLLEARFKLKAHRETRDLPRYALLLAAKGGALGPKLRRPSEDCRVASPQCTVHVAPGRFSAGLAPLAALTQYLERTVVQQVIVDRTDLYGLYEISLEWTDPSSVFTALQEQLGLKLEPERGPVDLVVIDHIERPAED